MTELEITAIPPLTAAQRSIANAHTLLNLYQVLHEELGQLGCDLAGDPGLLAVGLAECLRRVARLSDPAAALQDANRTGDLDHLVQGELADLLRRFPVGAASPAAGVTRAQIESLLWILNVRAREFVARTANPAHATPLTVADLEIDLQELFRTMEQHSRGRYRFVYNLALQEASDYYVDLRFAGSHSTAIPLPALVRETLRDLIANARKYTAPGGQIRVGLHSGTAGIRCVVEDTGRGIPAAELASVVQFGYRGSNVADVRSHGAGCGLTKAFLVARQFGGRFWIASELGRGTRIRFRIPPVAAGAVAPTALQE